MQTRIMPSADVDKRAHIGADTTVWHLAQVREHARLGRGCIVGRGAYVDAGVHIGDHVKLQNYALVYAPARLDDGVFIGPAAILTNDSYPRSISPDGGLKRGEDWQARGVSVGQGAAVGARAVVLGGVSIGRWAMIGAGAVVTHDVTEHALVVGTPARQVGWVGPAGVPLTEDGPGCWRCPQTGSRYLESDGRLLEAP
ncbi:MAG: N-acetyltransferase [Actinomycetota bacterium]|nr:N-acetyltransferase [Actinomycetota bacterium]